MILFHIHLIFSILPQNALANFPIENIKNLEFPLQDPLSPANPIHGISALEGKSLEKISEVFTDLPSKNLIDLLYHRIDEHHFFPSTTANSPASYLNAELIGKLVGTILKHQSSSASSGRSNDILKKELLDIYEQEQIKTHINNKFKEYEDNFKEYELQLTEIQTKLIDPATQDDIKERLRTQQSYLSKKRDQFKVTSEWKTKRNKFITHLSAHATDPYTIKVLLALLWNKADKKEDYFKYYEGLNQTHPSLLNKNHWELLSTKTQLKKKWLEDTFNEDQTPISMEEIKLAPPSLFVYKILNPENSQQQSLTLIEYESANYEGINFPDCGETSLRNFFRILMGTYSHQGKTLYNTRILHKIFQHTHILSRQLVDYFETFKSDEGQFTSEARNAWTKVVSSLNTQNPPLPPELGLPPINYRISFDKSGPKQCNLAGVGSGNMLSVIYKLIGIKSWDQLIEILNQPDHPPAEVGAAAAAAASRGDWNDDGETYKLEELRRPQFKINDSSFDQTSFGNLTFESPTQGQFKWHFNQGHFYMESISSVQQSQNELDQFIIPQILKYPALRGLHQLLPLGYKVPYILFPKLSEQKIVEQNEVTDFLMSAPFQTEQDIYYFYTNLLNYPEYSKLFTAEFFFGLFKKLTLNDAKLNFINEIKDHQSNLIKLIKLIEPELDKLFQIADENSVSKLVMILSQKKWIHKEPQLIELYKKFPQHQNNFLRLIFSQDHSTRLSPLIDESLKERKNLENITLNVLIQPHFSDKKVWLDEIYSTCETCKIDLIKFVLTKEWNQNRGDIIGDLVDSARFDQLLINHLLHLPHWHKNPEWKNWIRKIFERAQNNNSIKQNLYEYIFSLDVPEYYDFFRELTFTDIDSAMAQSDSQQKNFVTFLSNFLFQRPFMKNHFEQLQKLLPIMEVDDLKKIFKIIPLNHYGEEYFQMILSQLDLHPNSFDHELLNFSCRYANEKCHQILKKLISISHQDTNSQLYREIINNKWSPYPDLVVDFITEKYSTLAISSYVLNSDTWKNHPQLPLLFIEKNRTDLGVVQYIFNNPTLNYLDHPLWLIKVLLDPRNDSHINEKILPDPNFQCHPNFQSFFSQRPAQSPKITLEELRIFLQLKQQVDPSLEPQKSTCQ